MIIQKNARVWDAGTYISGEVLVLREDNLVGIELGRETLDERVEEGLISRLAEHPAVSKTKSGKTLRKKRVGKRRTA
jgi:hypothetical protein